MINQSETPRSGYSWMDLITVPVALALLTPLIYRLILIILNFIADLP